MNSTLFERGTIVGIAISALILMFYGLVSVWKDPVFIVTCFISVTAVLGCRYLYAATLQIQLNICQRYGGKPASMTDHIAILMIISIGAYLWIPDRGWNFFACHTLAPMWLALALHLKGEVFND
jgi:hypothetical protein